jgi:hypothetical protein
LFQNIVRFLAVFVVLLAALVLVAQGMCMGSSHKVLCSDLCETSSKAVSMKVLGAVVDFSCLEQHPNLKVGGGH